ncbi:MAG: ABC transporter ATP-binding protein [Dehalococcoidia bacterium]
MRRKRLIHTWDLTKYYGQATGVESLYMEVAEGETFGLLGLDGSGKSTTIRLLLGLTRPTRGQAEVLGFDIQRHSYQVRSLTGCVPGNFTFYGELTGTEFLGLCSQIRGNQAERRSELEERLDLDSSLKFQDYSIVDRQKIALIQALMHDPPLVILDDPTIGLDHLSKEAFYEIIAEERARGKTILLSTKSPPEIARLCDRVAILKGGYLERTEDVVEMRNRLGRKVRVTFRHHIDLEDIITEDVSVVSHREGEWVLAVRHEMGSLIQRLGQYSVKDVVYLEGAVEEALTEMLEGGPRVLVS